MKNHIIWQYRRNFQWQIEKLLKRHISQKLKINSKTFCKKNLSILKWNLKKRFIQWRFKKQIFEDTKKIKKCTKIQKHSQNKCSSVILSWNKWTYLFKKIFCYLSAQNSLNTRGGSGVKQILRYFYPQCLMLKISGESTCIVFSPQCLMFKISYKYIHHMWGGVTIIPTPEPHV